MADKSLPKGLTLNTKTGEYILRRNFRMPGGSRWDVARPLGVKTKAEAIARYAIENGKLQREAEARRRDADGIRMGRRATAEAEGLYWRQEIAEARTDAEHIAVTAAYDAVLDKTLGAPVGTETIYGGDDEPVYAKEAERRAKIISGIVSGTVVPVGAYFNEFSKGRSDSIRYGSRFRRAVTVLETWLAERPEGNNTRAVTEVTALEFLEVQLKEGLARRTLSAWKSSLNVYWDWLGRRGFVRPGVWRLAQMPRGNSSNKGVDKRAFTDTEMKVLLAGDPGDTLSDMIRIAALSGMRRGEIAYLTVANCAEGVFDIQDGKTENAARKIPIHPDLTAIVARRCAGKGPGEFLIEELKSPPSRGDRGRGDKIGERFTAYRRKVGVDAKREGKSQSDVDFHSLRRWFATKAERAGNPDHVISAVLGHSEGRKSLAMSVYSDGPSVDQWRTCVESVRLPSLEQVGSIEWP